MKKITTIALCFIGFSSLSHAGWLDAVKKVSETSAVTDQVKSAAAAANIPVDAQSLIVSAIKAQIGDNATPVTVKDKFGNPTVAPTKNAAGDEVWQYGMAGVLGGLGSAAAMLNDTAKDLTKTVQFTFKEGVVSQVELIDATTAIEDNAAK